MENCAYHIFKPDKGKAYQRQCGNDEIEIGKSGSGEPVCCSYEKEEKGGDTRWKKYLES